MIYLIKVNYTSYNYTPCNSTWTCLQRKVCHLKQRTSSLCKKVLLFGSPLHWYCILIPCNNVSRMDKFLKEGVSSKGTSINDVRRFLAIFDLLTNLVLPYNVQFWGLSWTSLPTLISDVINGRSKTINLYYNGGLLILTETNQWVALWDQKN